MNPTPEQDDSWEMRVQQAARDFQYPPTPDIAAALPRRPAKRAAPRRVALVMAALLLMCFAFVPQIRAGVLEFFRVGAVSIFRLETPTPAPLTPTLEGGVLRSVLELPGETTLEAALELTSYPVRLPTYPADLGAPSRVFLQQRRYPMLTLVWTAPGAPDQVRLSLHIINQGGFAGKYFPWSEQQTTVNGRVAVWLARPHRFEFYPDRGENAPTIIREINTGVLLWEEGNLTYRLETDLPLEEARRIAESLQ